MSEMRRTDLRSEHMARYHSATGNVHLRMRASSRDHDLNHHRSLGQRSKGTMTNPTHEEAERLADDCSQFALSHRNLAEDTDPQYGGSIQANNDMADWYYKVEAALRSLETRLEEAEIMAGVATNALNTAAALKVEIESLRCRLAEAERDKERLANAISDLEPLVNGKHNALSKDTMRFIVRSAIDAARDPKEKQNATG